MSTLLALQEATLWFAVFIAAALFACLLVPYLFEEGWRGKVDLGPRFPIGAGDGHPGYGGNPTPGEPAPPQPTPAAASELEQMEQALLERVRVEEADLAALAAARAKTVREYLAQSGKVEPERLFLAERQSGGSLKLEGSRVYLQLR